MISILKNKWLTLILALVTFIFATLSWTCHVFKFPTQDSCDKIKVPSIWLTLFTSLILLVASILNAFGGGGMSFSSF